MENEVAKTAEEKRAEYIEGLRSLAQFLEEHSDCKLPTQTDFHDYIFGKATFAANVKSLGACEKEYTEYYVTCTKKFGPLSYGFCITRSSVCEKKVVGKKIVPLQLSSYYPEVPEHEEDVVEWDCGSLLSPAEVEEAIENA